MDSVKQGVQRAGDTVKQAAESVKESLTGLQQSVNNLANLFTEAWQVSKRSALLLLLAFMLGVQPNQPPMNLPPLLALYFLPQIALDLSYKTFLYASLSI